MYGEDADTDQTWHKWFAKFHAGDFSLDNAPWSSRSAEVDSDQIETLIENIQPYTIQEIADILRIFKSIKLSVTMKVVSFYFYSFIFKILFIYLFYFWFTDQHSTTEPHQPEPKMCLFFFFTVKLNEFFGQPINCIVNPYITITHPQQ